MRFSAVTNRDPDNPELTARAPLNGENSGARQVESGTVLLAYAFVAQGVEGRTIIHLKLHGSGTTSASERFCCAVDHTRANGALR